MQTSNSKKYFEQAKDVMVGGVNSPVRSFKSIGGQAMVMKGGHRQKLFDYDGNEYTDYCLSWGALILGHAHRQIVLAAQKAVEKGTSFGTTTKEEIEIARHIIKNVPSVDLIRFVNSGTEATMSAVRLARGFTKNELIVKFDGCYHGHFDDFLTTAGSGVSLLMGSSSLGVPSNHIENTISLPFNDIDKFEKVIARYHSEIACVIMEPVAGNMAYSPLT